MDSALGMSRQSSIGSKMNSLTKKGAASAAPFPTRQRGLHSRLAGIFLHYQFIVYAERSEKLTRPHSGDLLIHRIDDGPVERARRRYDNEMGRS